MSEPAEKSLFEAPPMGEQERMVEAISLVLISVRNWRAPSRIRNRSCDGS
jgi:hypothetical protein